ncbi:MAG TPA: allophanate hydrolase, partial [Telmatospirillum sp.]|nr:allophanate hydrolase [Telmatospirillum sp.]
HAKGHDIVSDGIAHGAIQIPGSGLPFVLMADRQPTGGYPKIATIISADLGRMAQLQAGAIVHFEVVPVADAVAARRRIEDGLAAKIALIPLIRTAFPSELLLGLNLISGVVDGQEPG